MKPTKEILEQINQPMKFMFDFCEHLEEQNEEAIFSEERIKEIIDEEEEIDFIEFNFLGEHDVFTIDIEDFLLLSDEIKSINIVDHGHIKTKNHSYYIITTNEAQEEYSITEYPNAEIGSKIKIDILYESFIVGLVASKLGFYDNDYWATATQYSCIQVIYVENLRLKDDEELDIINSYIFEIADSTNIALTRSEIHLPNEYFLLNDNDEIRILEDLAPYNEGMRLFTSAVQINDPEFKFLNFYKVLEHFSPIAVNIEANELMRKKLDAPKSQFENGDYIRSIFELANSMRDRFNDEDLIKASFNSCIDFVGLIKELPESIQKKITGHLKIKELTYGTDKQLITTACNMAAKIIYKTRNKVVHAKSNFIATGEEVLLNEFQALNLFMKQASSQAIRWYARQPNHLKREIIL